jgi:hypothetical protein
MPLQVHLTGLRPLPQRPLLPARAQVLPAATAPTANASRPRPIEDWARTKLSPSDEEISKLRALIRRIEADLDELTDEDQEQIAEAVAVIRKTRQVVNPGMPAIKPPDTEAG